MPVALSHYRHEGRQRLWIALAVSSAAHFALVSAPTGLGSEAPAPRLEADIPLDVRFVRRGPGGAATSIDVPADQSVAAPPAEPPVAARKRDSGRAPVHDPIFYTWREVDVVARPASSAPMPMQAGAGAMELDLWIDERGNVREVKVVASEADRRLAHALTAHYRQLKFIPAMKDGRPKRFRARFVVDFGAAD